MEFSSVQNLCKLLISCAIQRCRKSDELCRLSVTLKPCPEFDPPRVRISVSDTGVGSNLEEYKALKCLDYSIIADSWDGVISITTTSLSDTEIHDFKLNMKEMVSSTRLSRLSSLSKTGSKFSGTEALFFTAESLSDVLANISLYLRKMFIVRIPKIAIELLVEGGSEPGSHYRNSVLSFDCDVLTSTDTSIEQLKSGFEEYISKHGNRLENICPTCFSDTKSNFKVGTGVASRSGKARSKRLTVEAMVIVSEASEEICSHCRPCNTRTEVLLFKDFTPCSVTKSCLDALTNIKWTDYGLSLETVAKQDDVVNLVWESLPPNIHIDIVLHCFSKENILMVPSVENRQIDRTLAQKALKLALTELKETNDGALLSDHALKIQNYAPDLARSISQLILSSLDLNFQKECLSILGLQMQDIDGSNVQSCIREKIMKIVGSNDNKARKDREPTATLFSDDCSWSEYMDEEYDEVESSYDNSM